MTPVKKQWHLDFAEVIDSYRVFPRLFLLSSFLATMAFTVWVSRWYMQIPASARGLEATGFTSIAVTSFWTFLKLVYADYASKGRDWNARANPTVTQTTLAQTTTTSP